MGRLWQSYRGWPRWAQISVAAVVTLVVIGIASSPKNKPSTTAPQVNTAAATVTTTAAPVAGSSSSCEVAGKVVEGYNILKPGASRGEYLTLLHRLQLDCTAIAKKLGLTGEFMPQCKRFNQESCTMYSKR